MEEAALKADRHFDSDGLEKTKRMSSVWKLRLEEEKQLNAQNLQGNSFDSSMSRQEGGTRRGSDTGDVVWTGGPVRGVAEAWRRRG